VARDLTRARDLHGTAFAGASECGRCHPDHVASWRRTFHRTMTQDVSAGRPAVVAGDFSSATYRYGNVVARMHRDDAGRFVMTFSGTSSAAAGVDAVVVRAVGSRRYQQYLADVGGVLWRLPMAFHVEEKRWFHMNGAFLTPDPAVDPGGGFEGGESAGTRPTFGGGEFDRHVTRWNDNCIFCHNVAPNPGLDPATGVFSTSVAELGIGCEACHGPGAEHAQINGDPVRRYVLHRSGVADPTIVNPARLSPSRAADLCGRCHGQRITDDLRPFLAHGDPFVPGDDLGLFSAPIWRESSLGGEAGIFAARFWNDGTPRLTAYEYQGLLQSRCSQRGILTCTNCHGMHDGDPRSQIRPTATGDRACTVCHLELAGLQAVARHTHHEPGGPGARCVSCHMPRIVYGVLDIHSSHRIEIPNPPRAMAMGRPDACTLCHVESDRAWAARQWERLWPSPEAPRRRPSVPDPLDDGLGPLDALRAGDPVARAVAADAIGRAPWPAVQAARDRARNCRIAALLESMANDRYPAIRHLAARGLASLLADRDPVASAHARQYDATALLSDRVTLLSSLRKLLSVPDASAADVDRISLLRAGSRQVDIDIGE
jgi:hypothetical protein